MLSVKVKDNFSFPIQIAEALLVYIYIFQYKPVLQSFALLAKKEEMRERNTIKYPNNEETLKHLL